MFNFGVLLFCQRPKENSKFISAFQAGVIKQVSGKFIFQHEDH